MLSNSFIGSAFVSLATFLAQLLVLQQGILYIVKREMSNVKLHTLTIHHSHYCSLSRPLNFSKPFHNGLLGTSSPGFILFNNSRAAGLQ